EVPRTGARVPITEDEHRRDGRVAADTDAAAAPDHSGRGRGLHTTKRVQMWRYQGRSSGGSPASNRVSVVSTGSRSRRNSFPRCHGVPSAGRAQRSRPIQPALRQARISKNDTMIIAGLTPADPPKTNEKFKI